MSTSSNGLLRRSRRLKEKTKNTGQPRRSRVTKKKGKQKQPQPQPHHPHHPPPSETTLAETLYLRVNRKFLLLLSAVTEDDPDPQPLPPLPGTSGNLNVIIADLPDLHPFTGDTVDWVIKIARFIFEPLGTSSLYTFTTESLDWWLEREMEPSLWRQVMPGEQLQATIYEFCPDNDAFISLTRRSKRHIRSTTTNTSAPRASTFRNALQQRDQTCIITRHTMVDLLVASHLIPRRLGDLGVRSTVQRFTGSPIIVDRFDPAIGVFLLSTVDLLVDGYKLGFWNIGPVSLLSFHTVSY